MSVVIQTPTRLPALRLIKLLHRVKAVIRHHIATAFELMKCGHVDARYFAASEHMDVACCTAASTSASAPTPLINTTICHKARELLCLATTVVICNVQQIGRIDDTGSLPANVVVASGIRLFIALGLIEVLFMQILVELDIACVVTCHEGLH